MRATVILSCFIVLVTILSGITVMTPETSKLTYLQFWIMFAVFLTFADACLQTLFGYIKQKEKKDSFSTSRVNEVSICIKVFSPQTNTNRLSKYLSLQFWQNFCCFLSEYLCASNIGTPAHSSHNSFSLHTNLQHTCAFFENFATPAHFTPKTECFIWYTYVVSNYT